MFVQGEMVMEDVDDLDLGDLDADLAPAHVGAGRGTALRGAASGTGSSGAAGVSGVRPFNCAVLQCASVRQYIGPINRASWVW